MTRRLNVLYKCMKLRWNISNGNQVTERTGFCDGQTDRREGKNNISPDPSSGRHNNTLKWNKGKGSFLTDVRALANLKLS